ncbi:MAG: hypothetical protein IBX68_10405 [Dehalococcoidia bacterium]|nr:hypothetical protein [Dehalococcoidia bacterium]
MSKQFDYVLSLVKPNGAKPKGRKVWSIDIETVWLPFFTATNTEGKSNLPHAALGAPLRLQYHGDGTVKFNDRTGRPVIKVASELNDAVKLVRENMVAGLISYAGHVQNKRTDDYREQLRLNVQAGKPIVEYDTAKLREAEAARAESELQEMLSEAERAESAPEQEREPVTA